MSNNRLGKAFFERSAVKVAKDLLGHYFVSTSGNKKVVGKIVETEAYSGTDDLACHASKGKTKRTEPLFGNAGTLYVYLNYGIFFLTNIVCDEQDFPAAVLIRGAEIKEGTTWAKERIAANKFVKANEFLATGPGKFSLAFGINGVCNQLDITKSDSRIYFLYNIDKSFDIIKSARIGVDYAGKCKDYPWRFYIKNNPYVSCKS